MKDRVESESEGQSKSKSVIDIEAIGKDLESISQRLKKESITGPIDHSEILDLIYSKVKMVDFREEAEKSGKVEKMLERHYLVPTVEKVIETVENVNLGVCNHQGTIYLYNGEFWNGFENEEFESFLGKSAEKMSVDKYNARLFTFKEKLIRQFFSASPKADKIDDGSVMINLKNGTLVFDGANINLKKPEKEDFITYQLPFNYDESAKYPIFQKYLDRVLPDKSNQMILAEYLGYLFVKTSEMKLEKTLLLYGSGANGKSVFFDVVYELLGGAENISNYSLQNLTNDNGYYRALIGDKLLNYASEINGKMDPTIFKLLVSGEPVDARLPYGDPFMLKNYAKMIFNCNELPDVEQSNAFFRRFIIIPFDVTIPEKEQDKSLAQKIIENELSGVLNWVIEGLNRLMKNRTFTESESSKNLLETYKIEADSISFFLDEECYTKSEYNMILIKTVFSKYTNFCKEMNLNAVTYKKFNQRLIDLGFQRHRRNDGLYLYADNRIDELIRESLNYGYRPDSESRSLDFKDE